METETMGRVLTEACVENLKDLWDVERGLKPAVVFCLSRIWKIAPFGLV